ncbi:MAG: short-chain dehydrogenase/reductase, partial [Mucilaginibacter sp.]|nr:short-chain dehydrogenase/reductase [Mucilaginibacter sp.]
LGTLYHGTKFAVEGISESLQYEMEQFGGKVKIVEPGAIATDFAGRSFDFNNDTALTEYQPMIGKVMAQIEPLFLNASPASVVADVIYQAATDGTDQLRYTAGDDAKVFIASRTESDDATFIGGMKAQFGL